MFGLFRWRRAACPASGVQLRLGLELLDGRAAPSSLLVQGGSGIAPLTSDSGLMAMVGSAAIAEEEGVDEEGEFATNSAPVISTFTVERLPDGRYQFSGTVTDENPAGLVVTLGGAPVSVEGVTATVSETGQFFVILTLNTDGTDMGSVSAQTVDGQGASSNVAITHVIP